MALDDMNEGLLRITNHQDHPTNNTYKVFFFHHFEQADYFAKLLLENEIKFERDEEPYKGKTLYLFAVSKSYLDKVTELNYLTLGKFRNPIFGTSKVNQYLILGFGLFVILAAILGAILSN